MKTVAVVVAMSALVFGGTICSAGDSDLVFDGVTNKRGSHVCVRGEDGLWWNINRYEEILKTLTSSDGTIPVQHLEKARFLSRRLSRLYEIAGQFDATATPKAQSGDCIANDTDSCGGYEYTYTSCADAEYDPPYVNCDQGKSASGLFKADPGSRAAGYHVQAWSAIDLDVSEPAGLSFEDSAVWIHPFEGRRRESRGALA